MNQDERAALERLLEYVGRGFCAVQSDCKMLREYLANPRHKFGEDLHAALTRARELNGGVAKYPQPPLELVHLLAGGKTVTTTIVAKTKKPKASTRSSKKSRR
jgi:hypothetical protein